MKKFSKKHRMKISYPNLDLARRPVPHDAFMPAPLPPKNELDTLADEVEEDSDKGSTPVLRIQQVLNMTQKKVQNLFCFPKNA